MQIMRRVQVRVHMIIPGDVHEKCTYPATSGGFQEDLGATLEPTYAATTPTASTAARENEEVLVNLSAMVWFRIGLRWCCGSKEAWEKRERRPEGTLR